MIERKIYSWLQELVHIYTASCVYQEHEGTTNVTLQTWDNVNASLNC